MVVALSTRRSWVRLPLRVLKVDRRSATVDLERVGWASASPSGRNPPAIAVQVRLLPDTWTGLGARPAERLPLKQEDVGSTPTGATDFGVGGGGAQIRRAPAGGIRFLGVSSNGKTAGLHPANEGSIPSTVHCSVVAASFPACRLVRSEIGTSDHLPRRPIASVVKRKSCDASNVEFRVRVLAEVLIDIPGVWRRHAALRRRRSCRFDSCRGYGIVVSG